MVRTAETSLTHFPAINIERSNAELMPSRAILLREPVSV